jgi:hypothetical protein
LKDFEELAQAINKSFKQDKEEGKKTTFKSISASELASLMKAASTMSTSLAMDDSGAEVSEIYEMHDLDSQVDVENEIAERDSMLKMMSSASSLSTIHKKVLRLKGVKI